ncbi:MAG: hypothetical protein AAGI44_03510 [Pseudomonadota bacterium]
MLVTNRFVFLHLHKSGGTFVNRFIRAYFPEVRMIGYHLPYSELPEAYANLPVFGLVRNPWSYYQSWYNFQTGKQRRNLLFNCVSNQGTLNFKASISNLLTLSEDRERIDFLAANLPREYPNRGINMTGRVIERLRGRDMGFYSFLYDRMYSGCAQLTLGNMESLRDDLHAFLVKIGVELDAAAMSALMTSPKLNESAQGDSKACYDQELAALVARKDQLVLARHAYEEPLQN